MPLQAPPQFRSARHSHAATSSVGADESAGAAGHREAHSAAHNAARAFVIGLISPPAVIALYLVKSALGINLLPGPSPLHTLFYHLVC